jgi:hypothetical protein
VGEPEGKSSSGKFKHRWGNYIKSTLKGRMKGWTYLGKFRQGWEDNVKVDLTKR